MVRGAAIVVVAVLAACGRFDNGTPSDDHADGGTPEGGTAVRDAGISEEGSAVAPPLDSGAITICPGVFCEDFERTLSQWAGLPGNQEGVHSGIESNGTGGHAFFFDVTKSDEVFDELLRATIKRPATMSHVRVDFSFHLSAPFRHSNLMALRLLSDNGQELAQPVFVAGDTQIGVATPSPSDYAGDDFTAKTGRWVAAWLAVDLSGTTATASVGADGGHMTTLSLPGLAKDLVTSVELECGLDYSVQGDPTSFRVGLDNVIVTLSP